MLSELDKKLIEYALKRCAYKAEVKNFIRRNYRILKRFLNGTTFQSGSYARKTAIQPVNDLDVIWVMPNELRSDIQTIQKDVKSILDEYSQLIQSGFLGKGVPVKTTPQEHSILIEFKERSDNLTMDVVPAVKLEQSRVDTVGKPFYAIPEVGIKKRQYRTKIIEEFKSMGKSVRWIKTDPKGYRELGKVMQKRHPYFKPVVKILKKWKNNVKKRYADGEFKLKSFHIEQIVYKLLESHACASGIELLTDFFTNLPFYIEQPRITDLAQEGTDVRYIDNYIKDLTEVQKANLNFRVKCAQYLLHDLQNELLDPNRIFEIIDRLVSPEEHIQAYGYSISTTLTSDPNALKINAILVTTQTKRSNYGGSYKRQNPAIVSDIYFSAESFGLKTTDVYWKVRNTGEDALSNDGYRGEITPNTTHRNPESTAYLGTHYVECYLIDKSKREVIAIATKKVQISMDYAGSFPKYNVRFC